MKNRLLTEGELQILNLPESLGVIDLYSLKDFQRKLPIFIPEGSAKCHRCGTITNNLHNHDITGNVLSGAHCFKCWGRVNNETYLDFDYDSPYSQNRLNPLHPGALVVGQNQD